MPFPRNRDFVGRASYLKALESDILNNLGFHIRLAICGLGGVG